MNDTQDRFLDNSQGSGKDPDDWDTGDEPMTPKQRSYLRNLCDKTDTEFDSDLSKAEAAKQIQELKELLEEDGQ